MKENENRAISPSEVKLVASAAVEIAAMELGSVTVATITTTAPASGILGWLGMTTTVTNPVTLPVSGILAASALVGYGLYKGYKAVAGKE